MQTSPRRSKLLQPSAFSIQHSELRIRNSVAFTGSPATSRDGKEDLGVVRRRARAAGTPRPRVARCRGLARLDALRERRRDSVATGDPSTTNELRIGGAGLPTRRQGCLPAVVIASGE